MNDKRELFEQFRAEASSFDEKPKEQLWNKLEQRLDQKRNVRRLKFYRLLAFAAMFTVIIAAVAYFNHYLTDHNPNYYVSNEGFTSYALEELEDDTDFYNTSSLFQINSAYKGANLKQNLLGQYSSISDDLTFNIRIKDYTYYLDFDQSDVSTLVLTEMNGNTLSFEFRDNVKLRFKIEPSGLRVIYSALSQDYEGMQFRKLANI